MSIFRKILNWIFPPYAFLEMPKKTLQDIDVLDDVWVLNSEKSLIKGWVFDKNKKHVIVTCPLENGEYSDYRFTITRPLTQTILTQGNKTLFLNKPCESEILSFFQQKEVM